MGPPPMGSMGPPPITNRHLGVTVSTFMKISVRTTKHGFTESPLKNLPLFSQPIFDSISNGFINRHT